MKRGLAGKTRRGAPPLPQQRRALRVVQITLIGLALWFGRLSVNAWVAYERPATPSAAQLAGIEQATLGEVVLLALIALGFLAGAIAMGLRIVRGPEPPRL